MPLEQVWLDEEYITAVRAHQTVVSSLCVEGSFLYSGSWDQSIKVGLSEAKYMALFECTWHRYLKLHTTVSSALVWLFGEVDLNDIGSRLEFVAVFINCEGCFQTSFKVSRLKK